jgi:hypothetical protein
MASKSDGPKRDSQGYIFDPRNKGFAFHPDKETMECYFKGKKSRSARRRAKALLIDKPKVP